MELDDDLLATVRQLAREQGVTLGQLISDLARQSLTAKTPIKVRNGVRLITSKPGGPRPDLALVNRIRDEE